MQEIRRGQIYYVKKANQQGAEMIAGRPAIVVSNNIQNVNSPVLEVVYLTTQPKAKLATHATVYATGRTSTALCEQVHTVDRLRLDAYIGELTTDKMTAVDNALMVSLGLKAVELTTTASTTDSAELIKVMAERDVLKEMYSKLMEQYITLLQAKNANSEPIVPTVTYSTNTEPRARSLNG